MSTLRFVVGDMKTIEFQLVTVDQDPPHAPEAINLTNYDSVGFVAKQIGPRPEDPSAFVPNVITITGSFVTPYDEGYVAIPFTPTDLDTPGEYLCRLKLTKTGTEIWTNAYDFSMSIREEF